MALKSIRPQTLRRVVEYLETELGLEVIGQHCLITPTLISYYHGMKTYDIADIIALRGAKINQAIESEPGEDDGY